MATASKKGSDDLENGDYIGDIDVDDLEDDKCGTTPPGKFSRRSAVPVGDEDGDDVRPVLRRRVAGEDTKISRRTHPVPIVEEFEEVGVVEEEPVRRRVRAVSLGRDEEARELAKQDFWRNLMESIQSGEGVTASRLPNGDYVIVRGIAVKTSILRKSEKRKFSQGFLEWRKEWDLMNREDKIAYAKDNKITWERHDSVHVDNINLAVAVREALGIVKYEDE
jgi:hypothetical protein